MNAGLQAQVEGSANELIVTALLMKRYHKVTQVDLPSSSYDILVDLGNDFVRVQAKTSHVSVPFTGGTRSGKDRLLPENYKDFIYRHSPETADIIVGITFDAFETPRMYMVPTILIEVWNQDSISLSKISCLRDCYEMLERSKDHDWVVKEAIKMGLVNRDYVLTYKPKAPEPFLAPTINNETYKFAVE